MKAIKSIAAAVAVLCAAGTLAAAPVAQQRTHESSAGGARGTEPFVLSPSKDEGPALGSSPSASTETSASQLPSSLALVEYLSLVRTHHPTLRAMALQQGMQQADVKTASTWANPSVHYARKPEEREWGVEQPLPIFGQIGMRTEAARLAAAAGAAERAAAVREILDQAAQRFAQLLVQQQKLSARQQAMAHLQQAAKVVQGQIDLGARSRYDGARMELQRAQMQLQLEQQQAQTQAARAALGELLAVPDWAPQAVGSLLPAQGTAPEQNFEALWLQAQPRLASLQAAHARVVQAEQFTRQQAREALPTPSVGVSRVRSRMGGGSYHQVGVSLELPLFDRKQGAVERAQLEYTQALLEQEAAQQRARQQLQQALHQRDLLRRALTRFEARGLSQLAPLRQMAQDAYRLGQSSILEWLDAMDSVSSHEQEYLDLTLQAWQAQWQLDAARGQMPLGGAPADGDCLPASCL